MTSSISLTYVGGPTAIIEYAGLRVLTDPTFDDPGDYPRPALVLHKLRGPGLPMAQVGAIDIVLLSHDEHPDNLDRSGRELLASAHHVLTTSGGAGRVGLSQAEGRDPWASVQINEVTVTWLPALHGPEGSVPVTGEVTGFLLEADGWPTVYVSGDNASLDVVREIAAKTEVDVAVLFAGAPMIPVYEVPIVLSARDAAEAARILGSPVVVPLHFEDWAHFTEQPADLAGAFETVPDVRFVMPERGSSVEINL